MDTTSPTIGALRALADLIEDESLPAPYVTASTLADGRVYLSVQISERTGSDAERVQRVHDWAAVLGVADIQRQDYEGEQSVGFNGHVGRYPIHVYAPALVPEAGCSCGWRGASADMDAHVEVCLLPDPADLARQEAASDGFIDNYDPEMDAPGADDYLADVTP